MSQKPVLKPVPDKYFDSWVENLPEASSAVVAITGTTSGTGYFAAVAAIRKHAAALILLNRDSERAKVSFEKLNEVKDSLESPTKLFTVDCDLMSFESVKSAAQKVTEIAEEFGGLSVLANNAGIMAFPDDRTVDGYEVQMQTNFLSHFLLTKLVFPSMLKAVENGKEVRICQQSSIERFGPNLHEKNFDKCPPKSLGGDAPLERMKRYHPTKLSNALFGLKLHKELIKNGHDVAKIKSVFAEPGVASTGLLDSTMGNVKGGLTKLAAHGIMKFRFLFLSVHGAGDGSLPLIEGMFGKEVEGGDFFYPKKGCVGPPYKAMAQGQLSKGNKKKEKEILNEKNQEILWRKAEEACGPFFESKEN